MKLPMSLIALAIASFGIGTTEFVIMGLLPDVARDLDVSIPAAGLLIGGYALGVTFGSPVMAALLSGVGRKTALLGLMGLFVIGNLLCAVAPSYGFLLAARLLTSLCHGTFFGIGAVVATTLVPPQQRAMAVSIMFSGLTLANVLGVPFGTALGQWAGWRMSFWAIVPIGILAALAVWRWLPASTVSQPTRLGQEMRVLGRPAVLLPMLVSVMMSGSLFATFTYVTPLLETVAGVSPRGVTLVLVLFGVGMTVGNLVGGRLADWRQLTSMLGLGAVLILVLVVFSVAASGPIQAAAIVTGWGLVHLASTVPLQSRVVDGAVGAPNLASVLNQSAFNLGNAIGAWLGGQMLLAGYSYAQLPLLSAGMAATGLVVLAFDGVLSRRRRMALVAAQ
ncbi:MFS transporter [Lichenihabitans sp. Uapishka_5]|uniref:MFS transporter n=1 Tax=Lichenihabitans sp. Uapishka_5 TaxID=3037302 RepID=UPI0029E7CF7F|nr:MFS transporter [Lichenihabitans sp. Uapishka_5]MDX7951926.1 MFS transporter [Lichenihabitans sp. Uapishka_5]